MLYRSSVQIHEDMMKIDRRGREETIRRKWRKDCFTCFHRHPVYLCLVDCRIQFEVASRLHKAPPPLRADLVTTDRGNEPKPRSLTEMLTGVDRLTARGPAQVRHSSLACTQYIVCGDITCVAKEDANEAQRTPCSLSPALLLAALGIWPRGSAQSAIHLTRCNKRAIATTSVG